MPSDEGTVVPEQAQENYKAEFELVTGRMRALGIEQQ
jgi:hypothetical protein